MNEIKKSYLALVPSALWSWILIWIPTGIEAIKISFAKYTYNDEQIIIKTGVIHQNQVSIPFYRLKDVQCTKNIIEDMLKVGSITLYDKDKTILLKYVDNPDTVANNLRELMLKEKKDNDLKVIEIQ